jgi:hypothetical protein
MKAPSIPSKLERKAILLLLVLNTAVLLFHLGVILKLIPYDIAWGGKLKNDGEMFVFETVSIFINLLFSFTLLLRGEYVRGPLSSNIVAVVLWVFFGIYVLNTVGNLFAETAFERYLSLLTALFAVLLALVLSRKRTA